MRSACDVRPQGVCQADGTMLVVKNCSLEAVNDMSGLRRSKSEGDVRLSAVGCPARASGRISHARGHEPLSALVSVAADGRRSGVVFSDSGQYRNSGCSDLVSCSSHSASRGPGRGQERELVGHQDAGRVDGKEEKHAAGICVQCRDQASKEGCASGRGCQCCHLPHSIRKRRMRPCMEVRMQKGSSSRRRAARLRLPPAPHGAGPATAVSRWWARGRVLAAACRRSPGARQRGQSQGGVLATRPWPSRRASQSARPVATRLPGAAAGRGV
ncbi:unnamed protein product [Prorocentrum cordatum]|uniref:Uncharacterized protein n=1 Tax=Prorocentrum cordatum TaxID=2364126 RepID=A0ABN9RPC5_9DINO|nr:unnamed protein product [Polarella glacialis]